MRALNPILLVVLVAAFAAGCRSVPERTYNVSGPTTQSLLNDLKHSASGPRDSAGNRGAAITSCQVGMAFEGNRSWLPVTSGPCRCTATATRAEVTTHVEVLLPRWVEYASRSSDCREKWDRFLSATRVHENGHVDICLDHADRIASAVRGAREKTFTVDGPSCDQACGAAGEALKAHLDRTYKGGVRALAEEQARYDAETKHGQLQGGVIESCQHP